MASENVKCAVVDGGIMVVTLNRPKQGNALSPDMFHTLAAMLQKGDADDAVRAIVVTGAGSFFSAGADVSAVAKSVMGGAGPAAMEDTLRNGSCKFTDVVIDVKKPLIAAVNGAVVGYPAALLGVFDIVYVSSAASYQVPFLHLAIVPEACSSFTLPRTVGVATANDILMHNRKLSAKELVDLRIAARELPAEGFLDATLALVRRGVGAAAASSLIQAKELIRGPLRAELHKVNKDETDRLVGQFNGGEPFERFMAMAEALKAKKRRQAKL